jgi:DNA-binding NtrC family response regulator
VALILAYPWPGNVRELQNEVQRALVMAGDGEVIRAEDLSPRLNPRPAEAAAPARKFLAARAEFERRFLQDALLRCNHHRTRTAAEVGLTRQGLFKLMKKHGLFER